MQVAQRRRVRSSAITAAVAALSIGLGTLSGSTPVASAKTCAPGWVRANIGGQTKCLHAGQYCTPSYGSVYRSHGFKCLPSGARYRLRRA